MVGALPSRRVAVALVATAACALLAALVAALGPARDVRSTYVWPGTTLPAGSRSPTWNGVLVEPHFVYSPQLIFLARYETIRMSQQSTPGTRSDLGNITTYTVGYRYNPFMTSRAGFAWHNEFNIFHQTGTAALSGSNINTSEVLAGFDFDF